MKQKPYKILFLCTGNACRSQMAEGWANHLRPKEIAAVSAGIETHGLNPHAVTVMAEMGVDISHHNSTHVDTYLNETFDLVITVCDAASETCPVFPNARKRLHVSFPDPPEMAETVRQNGGSAADELDCYRRVCRQIKAFIETLNPDA